MPKVQPCGELDLEKKCSLVSEYMPKVSIIVLAAYLILFSSISQMGGLILLVSQISAAILDEACNRLNGKGTNKETLKGAQLFLHDVYAVFASGKILD